MESGSFIGNTTRLMSRVYCPGFISAQSKYSRGENLTGMITFAHQVNKLPLLKLHYDTTRKTFNNLSSNLPHIMNKINDFDKMTADKSFKAVYNPLYHSSRYGSKITEFGFFRYSFMEKRMQNSEFGRYLLGMDKNLADLKCVQNSFSKFFNGAQIKTVVVKGSAQKFVVGANGAKASSAAALTAKGLGRIPVLGVALSAVFELPSVYRAFKQGDGINQVGRSAINIGGYTAGAALLGAAMTAVIPPLGGIIGAAIGVYVGGKIADKVGKFIFGTPKLKCNYNFFQNMPNNLFIR